MTDLIKPSRRGFLTGLTALFIAAPAIVRATSLMPVRWYEDYEPLFMTEPGPGLYEQLSVVTRRAFMPRLFVQLYTASPVLERLGLDIPSRSD